MSIEAQPFTWGIRPKHKWRDLALGIGITLLIVTTGILLTRKFGRIAPAPNRSRPSAPPAILRYETDSRSSLGPPGARCLSVSPRESLVFLGGDAGVLQSWNWETQSAHRVAEGGGPEIGSVAVHPDGNRAATGRRDGSVIEHPLSQPGEARRLGAQEEEVLTLAFSPDGTRLASGSTDGSVRVWFDGSVTVLGKHPEPVGSVAYVGRWLASASLDGTIRLWDSEKGESGPTLTGHKGVLTLAASPNGRFLASGGLDSTIRFWDVDSGRLLATLPHPAAVRTISFHPKGRWLASGSDDSAIRLWDLPGRTEVQKIDCGIGRVLAISFSSSGNELIALGDDQAVRIWRRRS